MAQMRHHLNFTLRSQVLRRISMKLDRYLLAWGRVADDNDGASAKNESLSALACYPGKLVPSGKGRLRFVARKW